MFLLPSILIMFFLSLKPRRLSFLFILMIIIKYYVVLTGQLRLLKHLHFFLSKHNYFGRTLSFIIISNKIRDNLRNMVVAGKNSLAFTVLHL